MKKINTLLFFVLLCNAGFAQVWKNLDSCSSPVDRGAAFAISGKGYIFGGNYFNNGGKTWAYDTASNSWAQVTSYPSDSVDGVVACGVNGIGYAGTGTYCCYQMGNNFFKYDPTAGAGGTWSRLINFPGHGRAYGVAFALDGKVYMGGGLYSSNGSTINSYNDFYCYDPGKNTWTQIANCPAKGISCDAVAFVIGDDAYVGSGGKINSLNQSVPQNDFWKYDTTSKTWTQIASIPGKRAEAAAFANCDKGYVGLGYTDSTRNTDDTDFWQYDPVKDDWKEIASYGGGQRNCPEAFTLGKTGYVGGGVTPSGYAHEDLWTFTAIVNPAFAADTSVCAGGKITFVDTSDFSPTNWLWTFNGGNPHTSTIKDTAIEYDTVGTYDITLTVWNGCDSATKTFSQYVHVGIGGTLDIEPQSPVLCDGSVIKLYVNGSTGSFTWSPATGLSASTGDTVLANPTADITYTVTGAGSGGCFATGTDAVSVVAAPNKPTIGKSANGDTLISSATQGNQWYYNDTLINGATDQTLIIAGQKIGSYTVEVINPANGCSATSDSLIASNINLVSAISNQVSIYPNPTTGSVSITINFSAQDLRNWSLSITDVLGRILFTKTSLNYTNEINLPLPDGVYFITIANKTERTVFTVVKQN